MKIVLLITLFAITLTSCNQKTKETDVTETTSTSSELYACSMHPEVTGKKGSACSKCGMELTELIPQEKETETQKDTTTVEAVKVQENKEVTQVSAKPFSTSEIVADYLKLKNALIKDDAKTAAASGTALLKILNTTDVSSLDGKSQKQFLNIAEDAKVHTKHIADNPSKIDHQREHFIMLSNNMNDLIKNFGTKQKLYQDFCPMANDGKGAIWISEVKEIKNPYYGSEMLGCGSLKKTF